MKILIVRLSALGDIVHAIPVLAAITRQWPEAQVDWLVEHAYAPVLSLATGLHRRIVVRGPASADTADTISFGGISAYASAASYLRAQRYDAALDLQGLIKSATWARVSGAKRVIGFDAAHLREPLARRLYTETVVPPKNVHVIQKNLSLLQALEIDGGPLQLPLEPVPSSATLEAIAAIGGAGKYLVLNPGAAWPNKRWPPEQFGLLAAALYERTQLRSFVTWGPAERALADTVCRWSKGAAQTAPPTSIADLAVLARDAALVISGDTGPLHIAAAMGAPLVGLYGPTWPERNGPWHPDDEVISRAGQCVCHHKRRCLTGSPCIETITLDEILAAADRRLATAARAR